MLSRIQIIKNVGRFIDSQSAGKVFGADTLIYGKNTNGKSTLTAILRSLLEGNSDLIVGRKTFGEGTAQQVRLVFDNNGTNVEYEFPSEKWNVGRSDILIFDNKFISDNVYEGERITHEHQLQLHEVLLGSDGRLIKLEVDKLQTRSKELEMRKRQMGQDFMRQVGGKHQVQLESFVAMKQIPNAEKQITAFEREALVLQNKQTILGLLTRHITSLQQVNFSDLKDTLGTTISVDATQIEEHIEQTWNNPNHTKHFLQEGTSLTKLDKKDCVFCGQQLGTDAKALLEIYEHFFKQGYEELQLKVSGMRKNFQMFNIEAVLRQIQADMGDHGLESGILEELIQEVVQQKIAVDAEIVNKGHNLQHTVDLETIDVLSKNVIEVATKLEKLKVDLQEEDDTKRLSQINTQLNGLRINSIRYLTEWVQFCDKLTKVDEEAAEVRKKRDDKRKKLQQHADRVYKIHKNSVNNFLKDMGADFKLQMTPLKKLVGKDERIFSLVFFDSFSVNITEENPTNYTFCNTLSDSDRRVLAFAFFLSLIAHDPDIDKKIVVFDDPISSLDDERKRKSIHLLADVGYTETDSNGKIHTKRPMQRIIMTHERGFFLDIHKIKPFGEGVTLKIESDGMHEGKKKSKLEHCDLEADFPEDKVIPYLRGLKAVRDDNRDIEDFEKFALHCRVVLEHIFKRKYFFELETKIKERKSVRSYVVELADQEAGDYDDETKKDVFIRLCDDLNIELHDSDAEKSDGDARSIVHDFFECLSCI